MLKITASAQLCLYGILHYCTITFLIRNFWHEIISYFIHFMLKVRDQESEKVGGLMEKFKTVISRNHTIWTGVYCVLLKDLITSRAGNRLFWCKSG